MSDLDVIKVHTENKQEAIADILFIHGLGGDYKLSWCAEDSKTSWPQWLSEEPYNLEVYSLKYVAPKVFFPNTSAADMPLYDKATEILDCLISNGIGKKPLIIISHSLGGILAKQILRICHDNNHKKWTALLNNTKGIVFLGTPHDGSSMANLVSSIPILNKNEILQTLKKNNETLRDLKAWYSNNAPSLKIKTKAYFETKKNEHGVLVVDQNSANPDVNNGYIVAVDADHTTISKPSSKNAPIFKSVLDFIEECLMDVELDEDEKEEMHHLDEEIERYQTQLDRLSLEEKLIKGKRDYDIRDARRKKEDFDKRLRRNSAQRSAKKHYVSLLSEVETRFSRHVYKLISQDASAEEVDDAIQKKVIDPIVDKYSANNRGVNAILIDEMIFYLTGLCNIRWHYDGT